MCQDGEVYPYLSVPVIVRNSQKRLQISFEGDNSLDAHRADFLVYAHVLEDGKGRVEECAETEQERLRSDLEEAVAHGGPVYVDVPESFRNFGEMVELNARARSKLCVTLKSAIEQAVLDCLQSVDEDFSLLKM